MSLGDPGNVRRMVERVMGNAGLHVESKKVHTRNLLGQVVESEKVMGIREGKYKITWSREPNGRITVRVTVHARDEESARRVAERLENLGAKVDVSESRVHAVFRVRGDGVRQVIDSIDVAEEATHEEK